MEAGNLNLTFGAGIPVTEGWRGKQCQQRKEMLHYVPTTSNSSNAGNIQAEVVEAIKVPCSLFTQSQKFTVMAFYLTNRKNLYPSLPI